MTKNISEIEQEIVDEFSLFDSWMDKYNYIIELGKSLSGLPEEFKRDEFLVRGCQSQVWLNAKMSDEDIVFDADSDALIVKGLIALLLRVLSGQKPEDVIEADLKFVDRIGLKEHLSPTRLNGLVAMIKKMKHYAITHSKSQSLSRNLK